MESGDRVTVSDAALVLDRSTEQVRRYLREGRLPGQRIGGQWFIERADLQAFGQSLSEGTGFLERLHAASDDDPLGGVIGIAHGGGSNIGEGKLAYRRSFWWKR